MLSRGTPMLSTFFRRVPLVFILSIVAVATLSLAYPAPARALTGAAGTPQAPPATPHLSPAPTDRPLAVPFWSRPDAFLCSSSASLDSLSKEHWIPLSPDQDPRHVCPRNSHPFFLRHVPLSPGLP